MLGTRLLHLLARVAVRAQTPLRAKRLVDAVGRLLPPLSLDEARAASQRLAGRGTCLTRALAVAARLPGSRVVIGSDGPSGPLFLAHAWVEHDGVTLGAAPPTRAVFVRL